MPEEAEQRAPEMNVKCKKKHARDESRRMDGRRIGWLRNFEGNFYKFYLLKRDICMLTGKKRRESFEHTIWIRIKTCYIRPPSTRCSS